jgi:hypothetical protein
VCRKTRSSEWFDSHIVALAPILDRYREKREDEPKDLREDLFRGPRTGALALIRDLHDLWLLANEVKLCWTILDQAARALRDAELEIIGAKLLAERERQMSWLMTRIRQAAPQALVVAE